MTVSLVPLSPEKELVRGDDFHFNFFVKQDKYKNENIATRKGRNIAFFNLVLMWPRAQRQKLEGNVATLHKLGRRTGKRLMLTMLMVMVMVMMLVIITSNVGQQG